MDGLVPGLRELGRRQGVERRQARVDVLERVGVPAALQLEPRRRRAEPHVAARLDRAERVHGCRRNRLAEVVAALVGVARRLPVAEPVVPAGDVATAAGEEEALRPRPRPLDRGAQRAGEVRIPEERVPAHQRRVAGEARHHRERRAVRPVDGQHADRGVDRALAARPG